MRVLITGGYGFIGGRLGQYLSEVGHEVVLGSRYADIPPTWLPDSEVVRIDWEDSDALDKICCNAEVVIHAAGMNAQDCATDPVAALNLNGLATARLVSAASRVGVRRFIYLSTAHIYNSPLVGSITEATCPRNVHPYATSHLAGENAVLGAQQRGEIEGVVLRLSNAFGAPVDMNVNCWMLLINDLCKQALVTGKLVLRSDGLQQRNFITLQDVSRCVEHFTSLKPSACLDGLFNIGGDYKFSVYDMAKLVASRCNVVLGFTPSIERVQPQTQDADTSLEYNTAKLKSTGFVLQDQIEDEIDTTLLFCVRAFGK